MQEQKFQFLKKVRKIFFAVAGSVLLLFLLYDLTELLVVSCPGTIRVYSCGKVPLETPYKVRLKSVSSSDHKYAEFRAPFVSLEGDNRSPLPFHRFDGKVFYAIRMSPDRERVLLIHKYLTFFLGIMGPSVFEVQDAGLVKIIQREQDRYMKEHDMKDN